MTNLTAIRESIRFNGSIFSVFLSRSYLLRREILKSSLKFAKICNGVTLDFGCGSKPYEKSFAGSKKYIGLDYKDDAISRESRKVDVYYDGVNIPFPTDEIDMVVAFEVFEHIHNLESILCEIYRVIKSDGYLCATTPFLFPLHEVPFDYQRLTRWKWEALLKSAGFEILEINSRPGGFTSMVHLNLIYLMSKVNPNTNTFLELLCWPFIFCMNIIGLIGTVIDNSDNQFPLSLEIVATKR